MGGGGGGAGGGGGGGGDLCSAPHSLLQVLKRECKSVLAIEI